jgi:hypothetical protein
MEHAGRVVLHFCLFKVKVFGLVVSDANLHVVLVVVLVVAAGISLRRPVGVE